MQYFNESIQGDLSISQRVQELVTFESFMMFSVAYMFIIWMTIILWTTMDANRRSNNILFQLMSILFVITLWPLGLFLYLLVRPSNIVNRKFISEVEDNLSILAHIVENSQKNLQFCPKCSKEISHTSKICTKCKTNLEKHCHECGHIVLKDWKNCLFCWEKISKKKKKKK
jgi:hypothetical protein